MIWIAIILILGLWGSGEAGEFDFTMPKPYAGGRVYVVPRVVMEYKMCYDDGECKAVTPERISPCEQKMREAMKKLREMLRGNENSRSLSRGFVMTDEIWLRDFEPIYQECVR